MHEDDEARYIISGSGYFDIRGRLRFVVSLEISLHLMGRGAHECLGPNSSDHW